jgi:hypothetical protein
MNRGIFYFCSIIFFLCLQVVTPEDKAVQEAKIIITGTLHQAQVCRHLALINESLFFL